MTGGDMKRMRVHGPGYQVTNMDGHGVCGVTETPVGLCRRWHVVCFRL